MNIKFRVWCKDFNGWEKDTVLLAPNGQKFHLGRNGKMIPIKPENHIVMMWTGLCDRQGKEIYEGDILKHYRGDFRGVDEFINCFVKYNCWSRWALNIGKNEIAELFPSNVKYDEVIGNVFENPELLKT